MADPFIGEIIMFAGNFAPQGWALCDGQLLPIAQNTALFSILGTTYGGDGQTTFGLPDLRGRVPVHSGMGPGLPNVQLGSKGGQNNVTLGVNNLPAHSHDIPCNSDDGETDEPDPNYLGKAGGGEAIFHSEENSVLAPTAETGNGDSVDIRQPYQSINFIIALTGTFPTQN